MDRWVAYAARIERGASAGVRERLGVAVNWKSPSSRLVTMARSPRAAMQQTATTTVVTAIQAIGMTMRSISQSFGSRGGFFSRMLSV